MFYEIILIDLKGIFADFRPHDFGTFVFWALWIWIVFASLKGVDRRDELAQVTYMAVVSAFGVLFILVFPLGRPPTYSPHGQIILFGALLLIPSLRWMMSRKLTDLDKRMQRIAAEKP